MRSVLTAAQMRGQDRRTIEEAGIPSAVLMERAALTIADEAERRLAGRAAAKSPLVLCVCGSGNNGGDGVACARILRERGIDARIFLLMGREHLSEENDRQVRTAEALDVPFEGEDAIDAADVIVDAVFGIGLTRPVTGYVLEIIRKINAAKAFVIAADIPSGIAADTGAVLGDAVKADVTVTMQFEKPGLLLYPGAAYAGKTVIAKIGILDGAPEGAAAVVEDRDAAELTGRRPSYGHKGTFGKVLVIAGRKDRCGAAYLCAAAAVRSGCGMVMILTEEDNRTILQQMLPEAMLLCYADTEEALEKLETGLAWADAVVCGPAIGTDDTALRIVERLLSDAEIPLVLDADALNILAGRKELLRGTEQCVITPHMGEMARLCGRPAERIALDRISAAKELADDLGVTVVLKDASCVIAGEDGKVFLCPGGNSGMATAGSGDVLAGITAGLLARAERKELAAAAACHLHQESGRRAAGKHGACYMKAGDILEGMEETLYSWEYGN